MKHVALFFVLGALLFAGKRLLEARRDLPLLVVRVPAAASPADVEREIDRALLTNLALDTDAVQVDPIVRDQLLRAMQSARTEHGADEELLTRALALGVHRVDPVVKERLSFQGEQLLRARITLGEPARPTLERYLARHAERYRVPERVSFRQVFLSRARRGERLSHDAEALRAELLRDPPAEGVEHRLSDPTILPLTQRDADARTLDARFGPGFGKAALGAPQKSWSEPIASAYGLHLLFVTSHAPARMPDVAELGPRLLADYQHDNLGERYQQALRALRAHYRVEVQRSGS